MIRLAELSDINDMMDLGIEFHSSVPHVSLPIDILKCREKMEQLLPLRKEWLFLISEQDDHTVGFLIAMIAPSFFSADIRSYELIWYMSPGYEKTKDTLKLLDTYIYWAKKAGCTHIGASHLYGHDGVAKIYKRRGFQPLEVSHLLKV